METRERGSTGGEGNIQTRGDEETQIRSGRCVDGDVIKEKVIQNEDKITKTMKLERIDRLRGEKRKKTMKLERIDTVDVLRKDDRRALTKK